MSAHRFNDLPTIAFDIDDVLGNCQAALVSWNNTNGFPPISTKDIFDFNLSLVFQCSDEETKRRLGLFMRGHLVRHMEPVPGAQEAVQELSQHTHQIAITGRPSYTIDFTRAWLDTHFPGRLQELVALDSTPLNTPISLKGDESARRGVKVIVEDSPFHAKSCLARGIKVVMPTTPWNHNFEAPGLTRIPNMTHCAKAVLNILSRIDLAG